MKQSFTLAQKMCGMSYWSYVTSTFAVSPGRPPAAGMLWGGSVTACVVNVTVAVCPRADAVTVTGCVEGGGWYTTEGPLSPEIVPGTVVDQVTSFAMETGE